MKILTLFLIIAALLQTTIVPLDLCAVLIAAKTYSYFDTGLYYLAVIFGVILGILLGVNVGVYALLFLSLIQAIRLVKQLDFSNNILFSIPVFLILFSVLNLVESLVFHHNFQLSIVISGVVLSLPCLYLIRFWEDRFRPNEIRLKIR